MEGEAKRFEDLSSEERITKVKEIAELLKVHELAHIQPKILEQVIFMVNRKELKPQLLLTIEGAVDA